MEAIDRAFADGLRSDYAKGDVINRSYGLSSWSDWNLRNQHDDMADFYDRLDARLPLTSNALQQLGVAEADKPFIVTAAGNDRDWDDRTLPQPGAALALFYPELRGLAFAVAALGPDGRIASYSNYCGDADRYTGEFAWNPAQHGRHYCLAAPGTVKAVASDGTVTSVSGTSFSAPIVSGALALLKEHFRGQMTPREIGKRMVGTADNTGHYTNAAVYGAGVLDLEAAASPIGAVSTGLPGGVAPAGLTHVAVPASWGDFGARLDGAELALFDETNAPFWTDLGARFTTASAGFDLRRRLLAAEAPAPEERLVAPYLAWSRPLSAAPGAGDWRVAFTSPAHGDGDIKSFGVSAVPFGTSLRVGFVHERSANQGGRPSGAFGSKATSSLAFVSRRWTRPVGDSPITAEAFWSVGAGRAEYPSRSMLDIGTGLYSAAAVGVAHVGERSHTRVSLEQPLRAESGEARVRRPVGRNLDGAWLYKTDTARLAPEAREVRFSVRHEHDTGKAGSLVLEAGHSFDAGHVPGREHSFAGLGWRVRW